MNDSTRRWAEVEEHPNKEPLLTDAEVLAEIGVTDEMIERAASQVLLEVLWQTLPNGNIAVGDHKAIAERVLLAALGVEHD